MRLGLRIQLYVVAFMWLCVVVGVVAMAWCGQPDAINLVVALGPTATVGTVAVFIEWRVEQED